MIEGQPTLSDWVRKAEQCDAAGNHVDAVSHLAVAAGKKDVEALTRLGKRLLVGDRAPALPNDGAKLLGDADLLGGPEAAAILSVLYAVGASRQHGLTDALDKLAVAANRGWRSAQQQLRVLAGEAAGSDTEHASEAAATNGDWRRLASAIDLSAWQAPVPGADISDSPRIRVVPKLASDGVCQWLIDNARDRLVPALVYEALSKKTQVSDTRTNTAATLNLVETDLVCVLLQIRMSACVNVPFRHFEPIAILHYDGGEEITAHYDFVDPDHPSYEQEIARKGQRIVTFLIYLNDDYTGGETEFLELGISHQGRRGEGLFFVNAHADGSADVRTLHAGRPPATGEKWVVSQFIRDRATF